MTLVLSLRKGQDFYVDDEQIVVESIRGKQSFDVKVVSTGKVHTITDEQATEVVPDVFLSSGGRAQGGLARIAIEAPPDVLILRGTKYRGES